jgi:hypothetical protein
MAQAEIDKEQITVEQDGAVGKAQFGTPRQILPGARLAGKGDRTFLRGNFWRVLAMKFH